MHQGNEKERAVRFDSDTTNDIPREEVLRKERDLAQRYLDLAGEIIVAIDSDEKISLINRQGIELLGFDESDIVGKNWFDSFLPAADREAVRMTYRQIMQGELSPVKYFENKVLTAGGKLRTISWHNSVLTDDANRRIGTLSAGRDVTEIRRAEEALQERDAWLESILSSVHECSIAVYDLDGRITNLWGSPEQDERYGIRAAEAVGHLITDVLPSAQGEIIFGRLQQVIETGEKVLVDVPLGMPSGDYWQTLSLAPIQNINGQVIGVVGFHLDITDRKQAERALQQSHDELERRVEQRTTKLSAVVNRLKDEILNRKQVEHALILSEKRYRESQRIAKLGHWEWDIASGNLFWSDEIFFIFGRSPQEFDATYDAFLKTIHPDDRKLVESFIADSLAGKRQYSIEHRIVLPDGEIRFVHEEADISRDDCGATVLMTGTVQDITDRKQSEIKIRELQDELAYVARHSTMGEMAAGLAHELNQPLAAISTYCYLGQERLAKTGSADVEKLRELFESSEKQAMRAGEVIKRLRSLAGKRTAIRSQVDIVEPIQEMLLLMEPDLRQNEVRVELQADHSNRVAFIDEIQIQQVLINLIRNALDAVSETDRDQRMLKITTLQTADGLIEVAVCDSGEGVSAGNKDQVFDAFFSTKSEGMGMGLAISRTIIESHGGRLWMSPNSDRGVTVHFTLPIANEESGNGGG